MANRAATVRERAVTGRSDILINGQATRLLTRAALIAPAGGLVHHVHE